MEYTGNTPDTRVRVDEMKITLPPVDQNDVQHAWTGQQFGQLCTFSHVRRSRLSEKEWALDVDLEMLIKELLIDIGQHPGAHNSSVTNQDVKLSKRLDRLLDEIFA